MKHSLIKKCLLGGVFCLFSLCVNAENILFLTNKNDNGNPEDASVISTLQAAGYVVTIKNSKYFDVSDLQGVDMIFLAEAIGSGDPTNLYAAELAGKIKVGIINNEPYAYQPSRFPWCGGTRKGTTNYGRLFVTNAGASHEIFKNIGVTAASVGEETSLEILQGAAKMAYVGVEDASRGKILATDGTATNTKALVVAFEKGSNLGKDNYGKDVIAQGRRLHFCIASSSQSLTDKGKEVLLSSVKWVIEGNSKIILNGQGYTTYYNGASNYVIPEDVEGWVAYMDGNNFMFEKAYDAGDVVPAGVALVLKGKAENLYDVQTTEDSALAQPSKNDLSGYDVETAIPADADSYFYSLSLNKENDLNSAGFYWFAAEGAAFTIPAHKAYLKVAKNAGAKAAFVFEDLVATNINAISKGKNENAPIYNTLGQRVNANAKGLLIQNGRKFINK